MYLKQSVGLILISSLLFSLTAAAKEPEVVPGEYIVKFRRGATSLHVHNKIHGKAQLKGAFSGGHSFHLKFDFLTSLASPTTISNSSSYI